MSLPEAAPVSSSQAESRLATREVWQTEIALRRQISEVALSNIQEPVTVRNLEDEDAAYNALTHLIRATSNTEEEAAATMEHIEGIKKQLLEIAPSLPVIHFLRRMQIKYLPSLI